MNIFKKKIWTKIIAVTCLILTLSNLGITNNKVYASEEEIWGGKLISPIIRLVTGIADGAVDLMQKAMMDSATSLIEIKEKDDNTKRIWGAFVVILAVLAVAVVVALGGWAVASVAALLGKTIVGVTFVLKTATIAAVLGIGVGVAVGKEFSDSWLAKDLQLPAYKVTSQEIFADKVWLFDVNFFNTNKVYTKKERRLVTDKKAETDSVIYEESKTSRAENGSIAWEHLADISWGQGFYQSDKNTFDNYNDWTNALSKDFSEYRQDTGLIDVINIINGQRSDNGEAAFVEIIQTEDGTIQLNIPNQTSGYTMRGVGYAEGTSKFYEKIQLLDHENVCYTINLEHTSIDTNMQSKIEIIRMGYVQLTETVDVPIESTAQQLRTVVSKWYFILRNLALLVLMLVLIYIGIKIVTGSTAGEKAKYKERLTDWLIALCLVMIMHYIMVFAVELVEKITDLVNEAVGENTYIAVIPVGDKADEIKVYDDGTYRLSNFVKDGKLLWPTDLMGAMRIEAQMVNEGTAKWVGYSLCFIVLVCYCFFFSWTYLKRVLYMAFLTMIAPLVAMTYPIDKITDGKAQAFNIWLKEYIFNLLIQPMHLLLYTVLVSSAFELIPDSPLYGVVAIGFIVPAEKLLRKFFGFEKAKTPGILGGAAGAAMTMTGIQSLMKHAPREKGGSAEENNGDRNNIKFSSSEGVSAIDQAIGNINFDDEIPNRAGNINIQTNQQQMASNAGKSLTINAGKGNVVSGQQASTVGTRSKGVQISLSNPNAQSAGAKFGLDGASATARGGQGSTARNTGATQKDKNKKGNKGRLLRTTGAVIGSYGRGQANKVWKRMQNGHPIRSLAKGALGLTGAATLGTIGLALGIASGDASKAFQYTTATVAGGYALGKGVAGSVAGALSVDGRAIKEDAELAWYGDDYKSAKLEQQKENFIKNEDNISYLRKTLGVSRSEARKILEEYSDACIDSGISKIEDVAAIREMVEKQNQSIEDAIAMKKFSDRLPKDITKMSASKIEGHRKRFQREIEDKLRPKVKHQLVEQIRIQHSDEIRLKAMQHLRDEGEDVQTEEARQKIEQIVNENIERHAELRISELAEAQSREIISGIVDFSEAKSSLREV